MMRLKLVYAIPGDGCGHYMLVHVHPERPRQADAREGLNRPWFIGWERHVRKEFEPLPQGMPWFVGAEKEIAWWTMYEGREMARCPVCKEPCPMYAELEKEFQRQYEENEEHRFEGWIL